MFLFLCHQLPLFSCHPTIIVGYYMLLTQWRATSAHHSPPRPPPGDSAEDNHTVLFSEHTLSLLTASRKTHPPAAQSKGEKSCYLFDLLFPFIHFWFTWHGPVVVVAGLDVGEVSGRLVLSGSNMHSLEKEMSSNAISPRWSRPILYLKTIWVEKKKSPTL